jgi:hypothetical protein
LRPAKVTPAKIELTNEIPVRKRPYRVAPDQRKAILEEIRKMEEAGIIRKSKSQYANAMIMVKKKDGKLRPCVDFRELNEKTMLDPYPLALIDDLLEEMAQSKYFSAIDLKAGYWQIPLCEESKKVTAFVTDNGHWEFNRLPFGLKNAPAHFSRMMAEVFEGLSFVTIYLDDVTIHSKSWEEHIEHVKTVLERIRKTGLWMNESKCQWAQMEVKTLGHIVSFRKIMPDGEKVRAIKDFTVPKNKKAIRQFLGLVGYYRKFIKDFAKIAEPLYKFQDGAKEIKWEEEHQKAFIQLKEAMLRAPVLRNPDWSKEFYISTDASDVALGAVIGQIDEEGKEYAVAFASKVLTKEQRNYTVTERECLAVLWGLEKSRYMVLGRKVKVITDHEALLWLRNLKDPSGRLARWARELQMYSLEIVHRPGRKHTNADALSRLVECNAILSQRKEPYDDKALKGLLEEGKLPEGTSKHEGKRVEKAAESMRMIYGTIE